MQYRSTRKRSVVPGPPTAAKPPQHAPSPSVSSRSVKMPSGQELATSASRRHSPSPQPTHLPSRATLQPRTSLLPISPPTRPVLSRPIETTEVPRLVCHSKVTALPRNGSMTIRSRPSRRRATSSTYPAALLQMPMPTLLNPLPMPSTPQ